jgi:OFA family oxalate/formate antiporter-like MFS transporter
MADPETKSTFEILGSSEKPKPNEHRFYYGWVIVGVIFLTGFASSAWLNTSLSIFLKPLTTEFGWTRSAFAGAGMIGTILGGLIALIVGPSIDRFGARGVLLVACLTTGLLFILLSSVHAIWQFYLIVIVGRLLLQGVLNIANTVVVSKWFLLRRGRASAMAALGQRLGTGILPFFSQVITNSHGWRTAATLLGAVSLSVTILPVLFWLKRQPEDMGLQVDGRLLEQADGAIEGRKGPTRDLERSYNLREVLRFRGFYFLLFGFILFQFVSTGINFNLLPYLTDRGLTSTEAVITLSVWSLIAIPSTLVVGYLAERTGLQKLLFGISFGITLGPVVLLFADNLATALLFAVIHGSFFGGVVLLQTLVFADYFGRGSLGAIRGFITPILMISNALGPLIATAVFDGTGSYALILKVYVVLSATVAVSVLLATPPRGIDERGKRTLLNPPT